MLTQGEKNEYFYITESGEFDILKDGERIGHGGPGYCLNEQVLFINKPSAITIQVSYIFPKKKVGSSQK